MIALRRVTDAEAGSQGGAWWLCRCDCKQEKLIRAGHLRHGKVHSCGCLRRDNMINRPVQTMLTGEQHDFISLAAKRMGLSVSAFMRAAAMMFANQTAPPKPDHGDPAPLPEKQKDQP